MVRPPIFSKNTFAATIGLILLHASIISAVRDPPNTNSQGNDAPIPDPAPSDSSQSNEPPFPGLTGQAVEDALQAVRHRFNEESIKSLPPPEWAEASNSIIITPEQWKEFTDIPGKVYVQESPWWYILMGIRQLRTFSGAAELMADSLYRTTENAEWQEYLREYWEIVSPITSRWYRQVQPNGQAVNNFRTQLHTDPPPGIFDIGGAVPIGAAMDDPAVQPTAQNPWRTDRLVIEFMQKSLFKYDKETVDGETAIYLSDTPFLEAWTAIQTAYSKLTPLVELIRARHDELPKPRTLATANLNMNPLLAGEFKRERIGYYLYHKKKYSNYVTIDTDIIPTLENPLWLAAGGEEAVRRMYGIYTLTLLIIHRAILALLMDMFADIGAKANIMARNSISSLEWDWALPNKPDFKVSLGTLEKYPEWIDGAYRTSAYPVTQADLDEIRAAASTEPAVIAALDSVKQKLGDFMADFHLDQLVWERAHELAEQRGEEKAALTVQERERARQPQNRSQRRRQQYRGG
ncbi:hypothetical protein ABW19_dt0202477 [Dactylella cylindrospora]|nr:hypothetical protein ABW19_dt0202477 [Dactylella cylindrospora]